MEINAIVIDSNAYAAFKKGDSQALSILQKADVVYVNPIILGELSDGFAGTDNQAKHKSELDLFLNSPRVKLVNINKTTSKIYSKIYQSLLKQNKPIPTNDIWIAATALQYNAVVFSYDVRTFQHIENLNVINSVDDL